MGAKVEFDNYYTMRDLNHDSTSWPLHHGENNLPNGQYHYNVLPRPTPDTFPGIDKELLKQKMLEHEAIFRSQVYELHRVYRVQKDLMDEMRKKEQCNHRTNFETSSSSSPLPSQRTSFLFTNGVCGAPPVLDLENVPSSADGSLKGKSAQCGPIQSRNCASPRNSEASESRPSKLRKMIDLQLPADEYMDTDEVEQCGHEMTNDSGDKSLPSRRDNIKSVLADLNEPLEPEETNCLQNGNLLTSVPGVSEVVSWKPDLGNVDGTRNNSLYNVNGNRQNWFLSVSKPEGSKDNDKSYNHINHSEKASLLSRPEQVMFENRNQLPGFFPPHHAKEDLWPAKANGRFNNLEGIMASHMPSNVPYSTLVNHWENSWRKPSNYLNHTSTSVQTTPFLDPAGLSKISQSAAPGNGFLEAWWCRSDKARSNLGFGSETPVKNGFYHGSSSGGYNDRAASGSSSFVKGTNSFDLNSTRELNLNVPDCLSNELEDSISVLPWLRAEATKTEASLLHDQHELQNRCEVDHQNPVASTSCNVDATRENPSSTKKILLGSEEREMDSEKKRVVLFDINLPCDDSEEFDIDDDKIGSPRPNGVRNTFDLNSCLMEDEIVSGAERGIIIDLEAPVNLEDEEEDVICLADEDLPDSSHETRARSAAEALVDFSTPALPQPPNETSASENALHWFADIACICPDNEVDCISSESDYFEEMTLKQTECSVEEYFPDPPNFGSLAVDESGPVNVTGRARRGPARRGRQRRDFQRDILPGLTSLARHEVTEDLQTFGGLMRATGHAWQCGTRRNSSRGGSGRGRRKAVVAVAPPPPPPPVVTVTAFSPSKQIQKNGEIMLEDRSLTSWGKTTRRPRRQRCPPAPIPLT